MANASASKEGVTFVKKDELTRRKSKKYGVFDKLVAYYCYNVDWDHPAGSTDRASVCLVGLH